MYCSIIARDNEWLSRLAVLCVVAGITNQIRICQNKNDCLTLRLKPKLLNKKFKKRRILKFSE